MNKDAIEYYYPEHLLQEIFSTTDTRDQIVTGYLENNPNGYNSIAISKTKLAITISEEIKEDDLDDADNELFVFLKDLP